MEGGDLGRRDEVPAPDQSGRPAADMKSVIACLHALSDFAGANADRLAEIDLNPIKALPEGRGCVVVDALIVLRPEQGK